MSDVMCATASFATTFALTTTTDELWLQLAISIISALVFGIINIGGKILSAWLVKKEIISEEHKEVIDSKIDDLTDDGKLNDSNR